MCNQAHLYSVDSCLKTVLEHLCAEHSSAVFIRGSRLSCFWFSTLLPCFQVSGWWKSCCQCCLVFSGFKASGIWLFKHAELFLSPWNQASGGVAWIRVHGYKGVCIRWLRKLQLLCFSIFLSFVHPMFPCTGKMLLCGYWPGILIFLSAPFSDLGMMQLVSKCCCWGFFGWISLCPSFCKHL